MPWPLATDFSAIVQQPRLAFRDPVLQSCRIERNRLNQPRVWSGAFAVVYKGIDSQGKAWAIRAFTSESRERRAPYEHISAHLKSQTPGCLVDFEYREASIRSASDGKWYPLVVMDWVEGTTLWAWAGTKCRKGKGPSLAKGARHWLKLIEELNAAEIAHGDLQHANVLVTPAGRLKLVDYDGMCVPALIGRRNLETGVRPYQHPQRNESTLLSADLDNFSALVIYVALRALAADTSLWTPHVEQTGYDKLLFRSEDFWDREQSALYHALMNSADPAVRTLAAQLFSFARGSLDSVPPLSELVADESGGVRREQEAAPGMPWQGAAPEAMPPPEKPGARVVLEVVAGPLQGQTFSVERHDTLLVGRGADCHVRLADDRRISRHQFLLEVVPPHARLRELGSRNGTYVNGVKYGGRAADKGEAEADAERGPEVDLKHGDQITAGRTVILLRVEGSPPPASVHVAPAKTTGKPVAPVDTPQRLIDQLAVGPEIGKGALGTVYQAECREDGQTVAVKIVQPKVEIGAAERRRVLEEMQQFQQLRHASVVTLLELGTLRRSLYFVMEFCDGGSLAQWLAEQSSKLTLGQARPLMFQCLDGLSDAHRRGLVHGDLKPQNVLLHRQGGKRTARIADFGLARIMEQAGCSGMTATGHVPVNYHFLPRERVVDFREARPVSDLWSVAAVFYHVLTGQFPRDLTGRDALAAVLHSESVPIRERNPQVPKPVAQVIDKALASDPGKRFQSAAEIKVHLERAFRQVRGA